LNRVKYAVSGLAIQMNVEYREKFLWIMALNWN